MKKIICLLLALLFVPLLPFSGAHSESDTIPEPTLSPNAEQYDETHPENLSADQLYALSAILISADSGEVIFEKDPDERRYPASTTKILTVLLGILCVDDVYQKVVVSDTAVMVPEDSSTMHLQAGEEIPFIDVLYGTMLLSGNDGANVIAETVSGNVQDFVSLMNETAATLGCTDTHFVNPHGYHDDYHYSTARDIAIIARAAMKNETFRQIARATSYTIARTNKQRARTITTKSSYMLQGTDEKPNKYYNPYATGIKTGSHSHSGYCFVGSAEKDGVSLISVVLFTGNRARWADTNKLMNYGFSQYMSVTPVELYNMHPITIETSGYSTSDKSRGRLLLVCRAQDTSVSSPRIVATKAEIERMANNLTETVVITYTRDFAAPITAGEQIGTMTYFPEFGDPVVYQLTASRSIERRVNVPKTIEEIYNETYADPNPLPRFSFELALIFASPFLVIAALVAAVIFLHKKRRSHRFRTPKPANRYVK